VKVRERQQKVTVRLLPPAYTKDAPDGGMVAWLVVLGAWCTSLCSFGWINSMSWSILDIFTNLPKALAFFRNITRQVLCATTQLTPYHGFHRYRSSP
jgi:hypothetical protein